MSRPVVCLYVVGAPGEVIRQAHGTYEDWFVRLLSAHDLTVLPFDGRSGELPGHPDLAELAGVVITGSPASLTAPEPWMEAAVELIRDAHGLRLPVLGVCFGHQLMGAAFGGQVERNPQGWEVSTFDIELTPMGRRDPLFDGLPDRFPANCSHEDMVVPELLSPYNGIHILAGNAKTAVQAVAAGPSIRGVQFHPEFTGAIMASHVRVHWDELHAEASSRGVAEDMPEALLGRVRDCPEAEQVLHNFVKHFVLGRAQP